MNEYELIIERGAMPKARPRSANGKHPYMPKKYMQWKEAFAEEAMLRRAVLVDEPVRLELELGRNLTVVRYSTLGYASKSRAGLLTGDVDNYAGGVMDALEGVCWKNDRLVFELEAEVR